MPLGDQLRADNHVRLTACDALDMFLQRPRRPVQIRTQNRDPRVRKQRLGFFGHAFHAGTHRGQLVDRLTGRAHRRHRFGFPTLMAHQAL